MAAVTRHQLLRLQRKPKVPFHRVEGLSFSHRSSATTQLGEDGVECDCLRHQESLDFHHVAVLHSRD